MARVNVEKIRAFFSKRIDEYLDEKCERNDTREFVRDCIAFCTVDAKQDELASCGSFDRAANIVQQDALNFYRDLQRHERESFRGIRYVGGVISSIFVILLGVQLRDYLSTAEEDTTFWLMAMGVILLSFSVGWLARSLVAPLLQMAEDLGTIWSRQFRMIKKRIKREG